ncbi:Gfo/Idh/MocA family protein [Streptomyces zagrosensis]|uniref:Putative dehydrogenase n=1 Tax=Streptomyces zagrosensis TaxID=1042984 RepID=A0A7W9V182_9ACTN|nr:Gfo/Idh/MocA family oxidoreductase [Streptomyces zagrosensis]MBB5939003.1 putative dehydrogenase [Streptomyces zagrosensis]
MTSPLIHAIIGCGRVAPNHVDAFAAQPGISVRWACDRDAAKARSLALAYDVPAVTTSVAEVLADAEVDSVSLAVDHAQHAELAAAALRAGKHVLVEKPLAMTVADGTELIELSERAGRVLSVVSQHRYDPLVRAVHDWLDSGLLGRLVSVHAVLQCGRTTTYYRDSYWRGTWSGEGGSALVNQGYHALDVVRSLCGGLSVVGAMTGTAHLREVMETEDTLAAVLSGSSGALVTYGVTVASVVPWRTRVTVVGTAGTVVFDLDHPGTLHFVEGGPELLREAEAERARTTREEPSGIDYYGISHRRQAADFCRAVRTGSPMTASGREGLETLRLLADLYRTGRRHAVVPQPATAG